MDGMGGMDGEGPNGEPGLGWEAWAEARVGPSVGKGGASGQRRHGRSSPGMEEGRHGGGGMDGMEEGHPGAGSLHVRKVWLWAAEGLAGRGASGKAGRRGTGHCTPWAGGGGGGSGGNGREWAA
jgi:hypothetical protein